MEDTKSGTAIIHLGTEAPSHFSTVYCPNLSRPRPSLTPGGFFEVLFSARL